MLTDVDALEPEIAERGVAVLRPAGFADACERARLDYLEALRRTPVQAPRRRFDLGDLAAGPWRKLAVGSRNGVGEAYAQVLQSIYFDCERPGYEALSGVFRTMIALRNRLMRVPADFGGSPATDGFWNACRVHHYPRGGGFMMTHRDTYFPVKLGDLPFYQVMVPLSVKGRDFLEGGGILITRQGERLNIDEVAGFGSLVIFDGRVQHGVDDVDPGEVLDFEDERGRLAAFANLYVVQQPATPDA